MYNKPDDHVDYLLQCLAAIQAEDSATAAGRGQQVAWHTFLPKTSENSLTCGLLLGQKGTPLPAIHGKRAVLLTASTHATNVATSTS